MRRSGATSNFLGVLFLAVLFIRFPGALDASVHAIRSVATEVGDHLNRSNATTSTAPTPPPATSTIVVAGFTLTVRPYDQAAAEAYDRDRWPQWRDLDGNGCDARSDVLIRDANGTAVTNGCQVTSGAWLSPYDGATITAPTDADIDHIVPLRNAEASGAATWDSALREQFANDPANLLVVSSATNRSRGDKSPDQWRPGLCETSAPGWCTTDLVTFNDAEFTPRWWCELSRRYAAAKASYGLSVTEREAAALVEMQSFCTG